VRRTASEVPLQARTNKIIVGPAAVDSSLHVNGIRTTLLVVRLRPFGKHSQGSCAVFGSFKVDDSPLKFTPRIFAFSDE